MVVPSSILSEAAPRVVTFTANPSIDRTIVLRGALRRGEVVRAIEVTEQAAGKGVNVARVVGAGGVPVVAITAALDPAFRALVDRDAAGPAVRGVVLPEEARVRVNTTVTEPDGTTTKINEPGPTVGMDHLERARALLLDAARGARWVAIAGSLIPGAPTAWYAQLTRDLRELGCRVAVDTSGAALEAVVDELPGGGFDLIKPNAEELAQLTGGSAHDLETAAATGDTGQIVAAAQSLHSRGIANVLVTLGGAGAILVAEDGVWGAAAPAIAVRSTVGAGDSSVAGFILAEVAGAPLADQLASAVRHGSAAASLPGTTLPTPADLLGIDVDVHPM